MLKQVTFVLVISLVLSGSFHGQTKSAGQMTSSNQFDVAAATIFAELALECVHKEYPNKISLSMNIDGDVGPPRKLTPSFYGCYDWHSSVHEHWLLARLARVYPDATFVPTARGAL